MMQSYWISELANHLWQSTAFAVVAGLLAWLLRNNRASTRYWIWLIASLKFLIPFALLIEVGNRLASWTVTSIARPNTPNVPAFSQAIDQLTQPFPQQEFPFTAQAAVHDLNLLPAALTFLWACGALVLAFSWIRGWLRIRAAVQQASIATLAADVPVLCSPSLLEPGIFGIVRPVLILPQGITERLNAAQVNAVIAHEMCHVRRRDNLTFALHMLVETIFWFHPLVWLLRTRLIEERERACDEAVLQAGSEAEDYAEGILNVCKFYIESPLACVSGVTGSDLKKRIVRIMTGGVAQNLSLGRKLLLGIVATIAVSLPVVLGLLHAAQVFAQTRLQDGATADLPKYDVATIKPSKSDGKRMSFMFSPNGVSLGSIPVQMMLREAFNVQDDRILGAPSWVKSDRFDVEAKATGADASKMDSLTVDQRRLMLRPLLEERFNLKYHHETRELPIYALVVAKGGPKLKASQAQAGNQRSGIRMSARGDFEGTNANIEILSHVLSEQPELGHTIVDKTGLTGNYDFRLQWTPSILGPMGPGPDGNAPGGEPSTDANGPSLFTALQEQLGLKLEPQKGPVDVIVIDHIEAPSAN